MLIPRSLVPSVLMVALISMVITGCGTKNTAGKLAFEGTITFQGKPLDHGTVQFAPIENQSKHGTGGLIKDGKYSFTAERGLPPGKYYIQVFSPEGGAPKQDAMPGDSQAADPERDVPTAKERIPENYNVISREEVEIKAKGENKFTLAIP